MTEKEFDQATNDELKVTVYGPTTSNVDIQVDGTLHPRKSWKTFAGMVYQLWLINKRYTRMSVQGDFTVRLPLPKGNYKR
jgi:hypothetical protein